MADRGRPTGRRGRGAGFALACLLAGVAAGGCKDDGGRVAGGLPATTAIATLAPLAVPTSGGTTITLTGANFLPGATIRVAGVVASGVVIVSRNLCTAVTPPGTAGPATVDLQNPGGSTASAVNGITYVSGVAPPPVILAVSPTLGPAGGGTGLTVSGSGFQAGATVTVGGAAATGVAVATAGRLTCTTTAGTPGSASVLVTNPDTQSAQAPLGFVYGSQPPTLVAVAPVSGPVAGGTSCTLSGLGFQGGTGPPPTVAFGGVAATNVQVLTATTITCVTAASTLVGPRDVVVTNATGGTSTLTAAYTYLGPKPLIGAVLPSSGPAAGGATITLSGSNFYPGATVRVGVDPATVTSVTSGVIVATSPAGAVGPASVVVTNLDRAWAYAPAAYTFLGATPTLATVNPATGPNAGGTTVTLAGTNFAAGAVVRFGTAVAAVGTLTATQIVVTTASAAPAMGLVNVTVTNGDGQVATRTNGYNLTAPAPTFAGLSPAVGPVAGGTPVTITGTNFWPGAAVTVGGTGATVLAISPTTIRCTTPAGTAGAQSVLVSNTDGQNVTAVNAFTYQGAVPTVTAANPTAGSDFGGVAITLTGTGFLAGATVTVNGSLAASVVVVSATSITATTPNVQPVVGPVPITVTNVDGLAGTLAAGYSATGAAPTLTSVSPLSGTTGGATLVTLAGSGFAPGATVTFGGAAATSVTVVAPTQLTCRTPAGAAGAVAVVVTNLDTQNITLASGYTYVGGPSVTSVSPTNGTDLGGTALTITGTNFAGGATVTVGGAAASSVVVVSTTSITCNTPAGTVGPADVVVINPGPIPGALPGGYTFTGTAPTVTAMAPAVGPLAGGTLVTLTGTGFAAGATVAIGAIPASVGSVTATQIVATTGAGPIGPANVVVTNPDANTGTLGAGFTYQGPFPTVSGVAPANGPAAGGVVVTITGSNFAPGATVTIGGVAAPAISVTGGVLVAMTGAGVPGPATVVVTNVDGRSASLPAAYTYLGTPPTLAAVAPGSGPAAGGTTITLTGTGFLAGATVRVNGVTAGGVVVVGATTLTAVTPDVRPALGPLAVSVTNVDGQGATLAAAFNALSLAPTVTAVAPGSGPNSGGTVLTLTGTNFAGGAVVTVGDTPAASVTVLSGTSATAVVPNLAPVVGPRAVALTNADGQSASLANAFIAIGPVPTLAGVAPATGSNGGGSVVTLTGTGFAAGATVTFGSGLATAVTVVSATTIVATTPALAPVVGPVSVGVTNADGQAVVAPNAFTAGGPTPILTSVAPANGPLAGGTTLTLTGTGFAAGATVTVGGVAASAVAIAPTVVTATTAAGTVGAQTVQITNGDGQSAALAAAFTYFGPTPTLTAVAPGSGTSSGGTTITCTGTNFASGATVSVGGLGASSVVVVSATSVTAVVPALAPVRGPQPVSVANPDGQSATLLTAFNAIGPAPTVTGVSPASGSAGGGTAITLTGTNFAGGATVMVGGTAATNPVVVSATTLTCFTPPGAAGAANVTVTNVDGTSGTRVGGYTFIAGPGLTTVAPGNGPLAGGTAVTLTGTSFASGATVTFGGGSATSVVVVSATSITCVTPAGAVGPVAVTITNPGPIAATLPAGYVFTGPVPTLTTASPAVGTTVGGTGCTLTGTGFVAGATVTVGGVAATGVVVASATSCTCVSPAGAVGPATIVLTNVDGNAASLPAGFTFQGPFPGVTGISPASGPAAGGTAITITGTNFAAGATVTIGGAVATIATVTPTAITATTVAGTGGTHQVTVTNLDGRAGALPAGFTYLGPVPTLTAIAPAVGPNSGGTTITCTGTNFVAGATVRVGGIAATGVVVVSATSVTAVTPSVAPTSGPLAVVVQNLDGQSATLTGGFTAQGAPPTLTGITPTSGPQAGGTTCTLTGTTFGAGTTVAFGGVPAANVAIISTTTCTATTPAAPGIGPQDVVVTNPDLQTATLVGGFNALGAAPTVAAVAPGSGPASGGTALTITGGNFVAGATVRVGGVATASATVVNGGTITTSTPNLGATVGPVAVSVTNVDGQADTLPGAFNALGATPTLSAVAPGAGPNGGGTTLTCTGTNFAAGATVSVGGVAATGVVVVSATSCTAVAPSVSPALGPLAVTVTNADGQAATLAAAWNALGGAPTLSAIAPTAGTTGGGTLVTLTGTNFSPGATVDVGGGLATGVTVVSATSCTAFTPAGAAGTVAVILTNADAQAVTLTSAYTFASGPAVTSVAPLSGPLAGGTTITISGGNFSGSATVTVGGASATSVNVVSASSITCVTPAGTAGPAAVTVTNPGPSASTLPNGFTYQWLPNAQTAAFVFDTAAGIDCRRRWYVNLNHPALHVDLKNRGLQSWGTPGDSTPAPGTLPLVDQYVVDWARAYVLRTLNIAYGRNGDGTRISGTSIQITFVGLPPGSGAPGCATPSTDWGELCVAGCDPSGNGGPHPSASQAACTSGTIGLAFFDNVGGAACNLGGERNCNATYHACGACGSPVGVFAGNIGDIWGVVLAGGQITAGDQPFLDGTVQSGLRHTQIHDHLKQYARRLAFVIAHEIGHSVGLVAGGTGGPCSASSGLCGATQGHNGCCTTNVMASALSLAGGFTDTTLGFSGNPAGPSSAAACSTGGTSSWTLLQAFCGTSP